MATLLANVSGSENSVRLFEVRASAGRVFKLPVRHLTRIGIDLGYRYSTLTVSDQAFGYTGLVGPEATLTLDTTLGKRSSIEAYLRWSLALDASGLASLRNHEWAEGVTWNYDRVGVRFSRTSLTIVNESISSKAWGLSGIYRFQF